MENIDWASLPFNYLKTDYNIRTSYKNGAWSKPQLTDDEYVNIHMSAPCLHYGVEAFEGLKAFCGVDGKIRLFRPDENAKRFASSARKLCMAELPVQTFVDMCKEVVAANRKFVPPYGTEASLYLRPFEIGVGAFLGVHPAKEFLTCIFVSPVGAYFKEGIKPIRVIINPDYDRAAPRGTGDIKCGGNYAASLEAGELANELGYANSMFLDAVERKYIEECGAANFFGIKDNTYVTPKSRSILPSITNLSLRQLAEDMGLKVEQRPISVDELGSFEECAACGTAAVISPIGYIYDKETGKEWHYDNAPGERCMKMYNKLRDIQYGRCEDPYGWTVVVE
jgi:branched-chain amino acid aminotransferase